MDGKIVILSLIFLLVGNLCVGLMFPKNREDSYQREDRLDQWLGQLNELGDSPQDQSKEDGGQDQATFFL